MLARLLSGVALLVSGPALAQQVSAPQPRSILTLPRVTAPSGSDLFLVQRQGLPVGSGTQAMSVDALTAYLNSQITNAPGIQAIATSIAAQAAAAASTAVQGETTRALAAEGANTTAISSETTRATAAEATNAAGITTERGRAQIAEGNNAGAISSEVSRATGAEGVNATAISGVITSIANEVTRAQGAESTNAAAVVTERTRAIAAEALAFPAASAGTAATQNVGPGGVASYGDSRITGAVQKTANLSDLASPASAANTLVTALPACTAGATLAPVPTGQAFQCQGLVLIAQ